MKPTPQDFIEAANALQDVAAMDKKSDTELLAEAVKVFERISTLRERADAVIGMVDYPHEKALNQAVKESRDFLANIER